MAVVGNTTFSAGNPWVFFGVTFAITWGFWLLAAVLGFGGNTAVGLLLGLLGLLGPGVAGIGFVYIVYDDAGRRDFWNRIKQIRRIGVRWLLVIFLLPPIVVISAAVADIALGGTSVWSSF